MYSLSRTFRVRQLGEVAVWGMKLVPIRAVCLRLLPLRANWEALWPSFQFDTARDEAARTDLRFAAFGVDGGAVDVPWADGAVRIYGRHCCAYPIERPHGAASQNSFGARVLVSIKRRQLRGRREGSSVGEGRPSPRRSCGSGKPRAADDAD